ncbi:MAG: DUF1800 domain-containing protein [Chloroflexi bacterium]|nr:DUF1800 domain-containing protein [Chloroflexota bacterium]
MGNSDVELIAHLMRRAGFGATRDQLDAYAAQGYDATAEELLNPGEEKRMGDDLIRRFHPELSGMMGPNASAQNWLFRMSTTTTPLREKIALFWHGIFATGYPKVIHGKALSDQIRMFRRHGMGSFRTLLVELSKDPAMIIWLDNQDNHKDAINENYGRELLELFSMGVGNYTEEDIKECARSFTGWTIANREYMELRSQRDSDWPYGRISWHFEYHPEDHDDGEKEFLGQRGRFNGEDIVDIICQQRATARFISRHMYSFFVADEPPVPEWADTPPADEQAIEQLSQAYFDSNYDISAMLRVLFNADFFKSRSSWYTKVKSPVELVAGVVRLTGEFDRPRREILDRQLQAVYMGQFLNNPPSVEGWHEGTDWLDTGTLVERVNFATQQIGDANKPGVQAMISNIASNAVGAISPERLVEACLDQIGALSVSEDSLRVLVDFAASGGQVVVGAGNSDGNSDDEEARRQIAAVLQMVASTQEFQRS